MSQLAFAQKWGSSSCACEREVSAAKLLGITSCTNRVSLKIKSQNHNLCISIDFNLQSSLIQLKTSDNFKWSRNYVTVKVYQLDSQVCLKFGVVGPLFTYKMADNTKLNTNLKFGVVSIISIGKSFFSTRRVYNFYRQKLYCVKWLFWDLLHNLCAMRVEKQQNFCL